MLTGQERVQSNARTYARNLPIMLVEARGARVKDQQGRWFIDCLAGAGSMALGYGHPVIEEAIRGALESGAPLQSLDLATPWRDAFVDELFRSLPPGLAKDGVVHLCAPSGANAVEAALMVAEMATGRDEHAAFRGSFHGCTRGARAVSGSAGLRTTFSSRTPYAHFLPYPDDYRSTEAMGGSAGGVEQSLDALSSLLADTGTGTRIASVIGEFLLGEGGSVAPPAEWMSGVREWATRYAVPLIADEIQSGVGRSGRMWSFEHGGIEPDILVASKGLGGGLPIAVIVMRSHLNVWPAGTFTGTFRGNTLAFATAAATLRFVHDEDLPGRAEKLGDRIRSEILSIGSRHEWIANVRGRGLMIGIEVVTPAGPRRPDASLARALQVECLRAGLIVEVGGTEDNVIRLLPPLTMTEDEADQALAAFRCAATTVNAGAEISRRAS